jgi:Ca2+-binding EF-hand superfamily protein
LVGIGINPGTEELQYYFNLFDKNQDDKISIEEFSSILKDFIRKELS